MKRVLIVGASFVTLRNYLIEHGIEYVVMKDVRKVISKDSDSHIFSCDFSSKETILKTLEEVKKLYKINGVITTYENYVIPSALIAEELGLPGISISSAEACTDKLLMRQQFAKCSAKISPDFKEVKSEKDLLDFASKHQYPLILKPANLVKSLLVTKNNSESELIKNYRQTIDSIAAIYSKYAPNRKPKILIEEYMTGSIHSVDAFVDKSGVPHVLEQIVDYETGYDIGFNDNFHYSRLLPSNLTIAEVQTIRKVAAIGCQALNMKSTPAHIELIRTKHGPMIVEIGARNGGYRERMHHLADGIDVLKNSLALSFDTKLDLRATKYDYCAVLELFPKKNGLFKAIANEKQLLKCKSLNYFAVKQIYGKQVGKSSEGYKMCAIIILAHSDKTTFENDLGFVKNKIVVETV